MFILSVLSDSHVRILPENLAKPREEAISDAIEDIYVDKVFPNLGLMISLYELVHFEGGTIYQLDGAATFTVTFKMVVFRPFVGEILTGKLIKSDSKGLQLSLGFFNDVYVPEHALQDPSTFDEIEKLWVWKIDDNEAFMDMGEEVRFRVAGLTFPPEPMASQVGALGDSENESANKNANACGEAKLGSISRPFAPMLLQGDINSDGLGCLSWWQ
mmetsp:Transcript_17707/g.24470  ORF Transcript_17707/g.24470 Transcript_17707/m.24470 type:complete len:215 (+) Transcript_17707:86-730(+)|eukprot:CAMPEP_0196572658 /NCGR_PEP_ID=MMETSP1081-20130531/2658_1 /TAXON_ID=36882 /ORGANISM="Pyramimonas amylifera, Strain CCMP720" /LENGTH=214 /DNA_ID=CAMNT_0041890041 /DNA_START=81 /DNA_END=725 /DNA_ORIENTATION=+